MILSGAYSARYASHIGRATAKTPLEVTPKHWYTRTYIRMRMRACHHRGPLEFDMSTSRLQSLRRILMAVLAGLHSLQLALANGEYQCSIPAGLDPNKPVGFIYPGACPPAPGGDGCTGCMYPECCGGYPLRCAAPGGADWDPSDPLQLKLHVERVGGGFLQDFPTEIVDQQYPPASQPPLQLCPGTYKFSAEVPSPDYDICQFGFHEIGRPDGIGQVRVDALVGDGNFVEASTCTCDYEYPDQLRYNLFPTRCYTLIGPGTYQIHASADDIPCQGDDSPVDVTVRFEIACWKAGGISFSEGELPANGYSQTDASLQINWCDANTPPIVLWEIVGDDHGASISAGSYSGGGATARITAGHRPGRVRVRASVMNEGFAGCGSVNGWLTFADDPKPKDPMAPSSPDDCKSNCPGGNCGTGSAEAHMAGSLNFEIDLGRDSSTRESYGRLYVFADEHRNDLALPTQLRYTRTSGSSDGDPIYVVWDVWDITGPQPGAQARAIRQVKTPTAFADIGYDGSVLDAGYRISVWENPPALTWNSANHRYELPNADPDVIWKVDPSGATGIIFERLEPEPTIKYQFTAGVGEDDWHLLTEYGGTLARQESLEWISYPTYDERRHEVLDPNGNLVSRVWERQQSFDTPSGEFGPVWTRREVYSGYGSSEVTTRAFYTDAGRAGLVRLQTDGDGSWVAYDYDPNGRVTVEQRRSIAHPDAPTGAPNPSQGRVTTHSYDSNPLAKLSNQPRVTSQSEDGALIGRVFFIVSNDEGYGRYVEQQVATQPTAALNDPGNLVSRVYYSSLDPNAPQYLRIIRRDTVERTCEMFSTFTAKTCGLDLSEPSNPQIDWTLDNLTASYREIRYVRPPGFYEHDALRGTVEVVVPDAEGRPIFRERRRSNLNSLTFGDGGQPRGARLSWSLWMYDVEGRIIQVRHSDGRIVDVVPGSCCESRTETREDGTVVQFIYDNLGNLQSETDYGAGALGEFPAQPSTTTSYLLTYLDAVSGGGRRVDRTKTAGGLTTTSSTTYDLLGRLLEETDERGLTTYYDYEALAGGERRTAIDRPGQPLEQTTYYVDGRIKSVSRGGVIETFFEYGVETAPADPNIGVGWRWTKKYSGSAGTSSPRVEQTWTDLADRVRLERSPAPPASGASSIDTKYEYYPPSTSSYWFTAESYPTKPTAHRRAPGKLAAIYRSGQAPMRFGYDSLARQSITWIETSGDPTLPETGPDGDHQIVVTELRFDSTGGFDPNALSDDPNAATQYERTTTFIYDASGARRVASMQHRQLSGLATGVSGFATARDALGNQTTQSTLIDRANKLVTQRTISPDSSIAAETVTRNGLLQKSTSSTGVVTRFYYDALGRRASVWDARTGFTFYEQSPWGVEAEYKTLRDPNGLEDPNAARIARTEYDYDSESGRLSTIRQLNYEGAPPAAVYRTTYYGYTARGELEKIWGDVPQPTWVEYDSNFGERTKLHTYRSTTADFSAATWPSGAGDGDVTTWVYDPASGVLKEKVYADGQKTQYTYSDAGRLKTRKWARDITTTYGYIGDSQGEAKTGALKTITYSGTADPGTPPVTFSYDRMGRVTQIVDGAGTRALSYDPNSLALTSETFTNASGNLDPNLAVLWAHQASPSTEVPGRFAGFDITRTGASVYAARHGYDPNTGRLTRATGPGLPAGDLTTTAGVTYGYAANSDLVSQLDVKNASNARLVGSARTYEAQRDLLAVVSNVWRPGDPNILTVSSYDYTNDALGRRAFRTDSGVAFSASTPNRFGYNSRNELTGMVRDPNTPSARTWSYAYDPIGNRTSASYTEPGSSAKSWTYESNTLNQYPKITAAAGGNPAKHRTTYDADGNLVTEYSAGDADCDGDVDFFDIDPFYAKLGCPGSGLPACNQGCPWQNSDVDGDGDVDFFDIDPLVGALASPSLAARRYTWDGENRLIRVEPLRQPKNGDLKIEYRYDHQSRRIERKVTAWDQGAWKTTPEEQVRYVWAGWLLLMELENVGGTGFQPVRKYTWGLDLAGLAGAGAGGPDSNRSASALESAGGIGGLLAVWDSNGTSGTTTDDMSYVFCYDGNGNVGQLIDPNSTIAPSLGDTGSALRARYDYDAYGTVTAESGAYAARNRWRFSTKPFDAATGHGYWVFRPYEPKMGRWVTRDSLEEDGGLLLYRYCANTPATLIDSLGQDIKAPGPRSPVIATGCGTWTKPDGTVVSIASEIQSGVDRTCKFIEDLRNVLGNRTQEAQLQACLNRNSSTNGMKTKAIGAMLDKVYASACTSSREFECKCNKDDKWCAGTGPGQVSGPPGMVTVSWLGGYNGQKIRVCTDNIVDIHSDLADPDKMLHELLRWWVSDQVDPVTTQREIDKWRQVPAVIRLCSGRNHWNGP